MAYSSHRSTRLLQSIGRRQYDGIMWLALRSVKSNNVDFSKILLRRGSTSATLRSLLFKNQVIKIKHLKISNNLRYSNNWIQRERKKIELSQIRKHFVFHLIGATIGEGRAAQYFTWKYFLITLSSEPFFTTELQNPCIFSSTYTCNRP